MANLKWHRGVCNAGSLEDEQFVRQCEVKSDN
jgi:hypothetical protein